MSLAPLHFQDNDYLKVVSDTKSVSLEPYGEMNFNTTYNVSIPSGYTGIGIVGFSTSPHYQIVTLRWENDNYSGYIKNLTDTAQTHNVT